MNPSGRDYWRSLEELAETPGFAAIVEPRCPGFAPPPTT
jgi:MoCo/4Fe-4S cofactor protein with predicted Tat translocation signal